MGVTFSKDAAKRISDAVRKVERQGLNRTGAQTPSWEGSTEFWAILRGMDLDGRYSFQKVRPDPAALLKQFTPYGNPYPNQTTMKATGIDADPVSGSSNHFEVVVEYTRPDPSRPIGNPLNRPPEISWSHGEASAPYFIDKSDPPKPVVNSAGDPFDQFREREEGEMLITITVNEASHDAAVADTFSHSINAGNVTIDGTTYAEHTLKLSPIAATKVVETVEENGIEQTFVYYRRTYSLKARKDGWLDKVLDVGMNEKVGTLANGFKIKPIVDAINVPVKRPYPLDGQGKKKLHVTDTPAELEFKPYEIKSWSGLKFTDAGIWQQAA